VVSVSDEIKRSALEAGFDVAGIAPITAWHDLEFARAWVEKGYGGEMAYLRNPKRGDPRMILPSAESVVCVGLVYNVALPYSTSCETDVRSGPPASGDAPATASPADSSDDEGPRGWISRYAWGVDYHRVMRERLERLRLVIEKLAPQVETRVYVDTGPVVERAFARLSGVGWVGKNTCLIHQEKGSWIFLGVILTSLKLEADTPAFDRCGSCTRCLEACPTGALTEAYVMDASRCIAYFNIELKGSIPERFRPAIGANVIGCDICQDVCPWNRGSVIPGLSNGTIVRRQAATTSVPEFKPLIVERDSSADPPESTAARTESRTGRPEARPFSLFHPRLADLASLGEADFRRVFARSPVKRVKYRGWLRNLCVVIGNSGDARFVPWLKTLGKHEDAVVREHAGWALERLGGAAGGQL
jgi:epoxyqueuosine reductase